MLLERPLSLQLIFHNYNQFKSQRETEVTWMSNPLTFPVFFFFLFSFLLLVCSCFFLLLSIPAFFFVLFFFCSFRVGLFLYFFFCSFRIGRFLLLLLVCSRFFFLLLSIPAFFLVPFVDIVLWCLKLQFTVTRFILSPWRTRLAQAPN